MEQVYICPECKSTKTIKRPPHMNKFVFLNQLPEQLICGVGGCTSYCYPIVRRT